MMKILILRIIIINMIIAIATIKTNNSIIIKMKIFINNKV